MIRPVLRLGNGVSYTLETFGSRIAEQITGPDGLLTRKIRRIFDTLNDLQQITGALK